jgi:hypothetical protein
MMGELVIDLLFNVAKRGIEMFDVLGARFL